MEGRGHITNEIPLFDGNNYAYWRNITQIYLTYLGVDIWLLVVNGYKVPKTTPTDPDEKKLMRCDANTWHIILGGLTPAIASKVMNCSTTKEVWDKLKNVYEGEPKVKQFKLQRHRALFENMKMDEKEDIATYILKVDEVVNSIRGLGEEINESLVVHKVLRSLPARYDAKVSAIEENRDLTKMTMDELHGSLIEYEMIACIENEQSNRESSFKAMKKTKDEEHKAKEK
jgi:hypothetical protein